MVARGDYEQSLHGRGPSFRLQKIPIGQMAAFGALPAHKRLVVALPVYSRDVWRQGFWRKSFRGRGPFRRRQKVSMGPVVASMGCM